MGNSTTKFLVTLPKTIADKYQIQAGDEAEGSDSGDGIHVVPPKTLPRMLNTQERLRLFDDATSRQQMRQTEMTEAKQGESPDRGWTREEIYNRDFPR